MLLDRGHATNASLQTEARKKPVPPIEITEAYGPPIIWYDRLINLSRRCSTWRENDQTGSTFGSDQDSNRWHPTCAWYHTQAETVFPLSFIPSTSYRSESFTILSPSPLLLLVHPRQVQATLDRSRISTLASSPITCVRGCATTPALKMTEAALEKNSLSRVEMRTSRMGGFIWELNKSSRIMAQTSFFYVRTASIFIYCFNNFVGQARKHLKNIMI